MTAATAGLLARAVAGLLSRFGAAEVEEHQIVEWVSATFAGERHRIRLMLDTPSRPDIAALAMRLAETEIALPGYLVADMALAGHCHAGKRTILEIEALTLVAS